MQKHTRSRFSRPQPQELSRQQIPEDAENEQDDGVSANQFESCENFRETNALYYDKNSMATTLDDVKIRMLHQDYTPNYDSEVLTQLECNLIKGFRHCHVGWRLVA